MNNNQPKYLVLDIETSGLSPYQGHGLLQVAGLALDNKMQVIGQYNEYIKPPYNTIFDPIADRIHKIPRETTENGLSYQEFCEHFIAWVDEIFRESKSGIKPIMIGQFFTFDYNFLAYVVDTTLGQNELIFDSITGQYGLFQKVLSRDCIDTKTLVNIINTKAELEGLDPVFPITSLSKQGGLKDVLGIDKTQIIAHDALDDCLATREVLVRLLEIIKL